MEDSPGAMRVAVERLRSDAGHRRALRVANGRFLQANSWTRRFGLAIWALALGCLALGALVWWQLLRDLP